MKIYNQLAYKDHLGFSKTLTIASDGCLCACLASIAGRTPPDMNKFLKESGAFIPGTALLTLQRAVQLLGWKWIGKQTTIEPMPKLSPIIKEVDFSVRPGRNQHFVVRVVETNGDRYILDPWQGVRRNANYYEAKTGNAGWTRGGFSYRIFKK